MLNARASDQDGNLLSPLPAADVRSLTMALDEPPEVDLGLHADHARSLQVTPGAEVHVYEDGNPVPLFMGPPWKVRRGKGTRILTVTAAGIESVFHRRFIRATLASSAAEQFQIAWDVIAHTQAEPGGDLNVTADVWTPSGVTRDQTYHPYSLTTVHEALHAFRSIQGGFDWAVVPASANSRLWTPYYPQRGTLRDRQVGYGPHTAGNVADYSGTVSMEGMVTRGFVTGSGDGPNRLIGSYADPDLGTTKALLEDHRAGSSSMEQQATADGYAQEMVEARSVPLTTVDSVDVTGPLAFVQSLRPGDTVPVRIDDGWFQVDATYRVTKVRWPGTFDRATLTLEPT